MCLAELWTRDLSRIGYCLSRLRSWTLPTNTSCSLPAFSHHAFAFIVLHYLHLLVAFIFPLPPHYVMCLLSLHYPHCIVHRLASHLWFAFIRLLWLIFCSSFIFASFAKHVTYSSFLCCPTFLSFPIFYTCCSGAPLLCFTVHTYASFFNYYSFPEFLYIMFILVINVPYI